VLKLLEILLGFFNRKDPDLEEASQTPPDRPFPSESTTGIEEASPVVPASGDQEESDVKDPQILQEDRMLPRTSLRGRIEIMASEAIILNRYLDSKGIWTIAVGVTASAGASIDPRVFKGVITLERAVDMFQHLLPKYEKIVYNLMDGPDKAAELEQHEFDALVSLAWNAGNINKPMTRRLARSGDIAGAIDIWRADRSLWSRRDKEVELAAHGIYSAKTVLVGMADPNGLVLQSTMKRRRVDTLIAMMENHGGLA